MQGSLKIHYELQQAKQDLSLKRTIHYIKTNETREATRRLRYCHMTNETSKEQSVQRSTSKSQSPERQHAVQDKCFEAEPTTFQNKTCFSKSKTLIFTAKQHKIMTTEKQHKIMTSEPITATH